MTAGDVADQAVRHTGPDGFVLATHERSLMLRFAAGRPTQSTLRATAYLARAMVALGLALVRRWPAVLDHPPEVVA